MRSVLFLVPVWFFSLGALLLGATSGPAESGTLYVGLGVLGVCVANALMLQHRRIAALERRLARMPD